MNTSLRNTLTLVTIIILFTGQLYNVSGYNFFKKPLGDNGAGVTLQRPFGHTGAGVTWRTPLGRNGLGYKPLSKPIGNNGKQLEKWVSDNREVLIFAAVTIVAIVTVQPEISAITWSDISVIASSDGVAVGVTVATSPQSRPAASAKATGTAAPERYDVPIWPLGISPDVFDYLKKHHETGLDDPRVKALTQFMEHPTLRKDFETALDQADKMSWPAQCDPRLIKEDLGIAHDALKFGDFMYAYIKEKKTLDGAVDDPRFIALQTKVDQHMQALASLHLTYDQVKKCNAALKAKLKVDSDKKSHGKPPPPKT